MTYYLYQNGETKGPYTLGQLRSLWHAGTITGETRFCQVGSEVWYHLRMMIDELDPSPESHPPQPTVMSAGKMPWYRFTVCSRTHICATVAMIAIAAAGVWAAVNYYRHSARFAATASQPALPALPPNFKPQLSEFLSAGIRLATLTKQGVTIDAYGEQLATAATSFELVSAMWPDDYAPVARQEMVQAMRGWRLLMQLWRKSIEAPTGSYYAEHPELLMCYDPKTIRALDEYAPGQISHGQFLDDDKDMPDGIRYKANIKVLMKVAAAHFRAGEADFKGSPLGK